MVRASISHLVDSDYKFFELLSAVGFFLQGEVFQIFPSTQAEQNLGHFMTGASWLHAEVSDQRDYPPKGTSILGGDPAPVHKSCRGRGNADRGIVYDGRVRGHDLVG